MKHYALIALVVLTTIGCQQTQYDSAPDPAHVAWTKLLGESIKLHAQVSLADRARVTQSWADAPSTSLLVSFWAPADTFRGGPGRPPVASFVLVPWSTFEGSPGILTTVTDHTLVFESDDLYVMSSSDELQAACRALMEGVVDAPGNEEAWRTDDAPALPNPLTGHVARVARHYTQYDVTNLDDAPDQAILASMAPGRMLLLVDAHADPSAVWVHPAPMPSRPPEPGEQTVGPDVDLKAEGKVMDQQVRNIFGATLGSALAQKDKSEAARRRLFEEALPSLKKAIFAYAGHTGPATAAGAAAYERAQEHLARWLVLDSMPDSAADFGGVDATGPLEEAVNIPPGFELENPASFLLRESLEELPQLLADLAKAKEQAKKDPGRWVEGRVELGADLKQYEPSEADHVVAAIGDSIQSIVQSAAPEELAAVLKKAGITDKQVTYDRFTTRLAKVVGTGPFEWSSGPIPTTVSLTSK